MQIMILLTSLEHVESVPFWVHLKLAQGLCDSPFHVALESQGIGSVWPGPLAWGLSTFNRANSKVSFLTRS
jgi:hypothetical protein